MAKVVVVISTEEYQNTADFKEAVKALLDQQFLHLGPGSCGVYFDSMEQDHLLQYNWKYRFVADEMVKLAF